ncbi:hypothetical protein Q7P35_011671 [Cladosporium inversicolor]
MFYSTVVLAAAAFSGLVAAQSGNSTVTIDPNSVTAATRQTWCRAQLQTCPQLCEDQRTTAGGNTCDSNTLSYNCTCASDNQSPAVADYEQTLPALVCEQYVIQCTAAHPDDAPGQKVCQSTTCGKKSVDDIASSSSSSESSSSTSTATSSASGSDASSTASPTSGGDEASSTASQAASSATGSSAASGSNIASTGALAVGILAAFGFAL